MRTFEIILLLTVTILPFIKRPVLRRVQANHILIFLGVLLSLHLVIEGWRWQMIPAYILLLILAWRIKVLDTAEPVRLNFLRGAGFLGIIALTVVGWVLPMALPVFSLPEPTGSYSVGTEMVQVETQMDELFTEDPNDKRELMLKVWYPSEADVSSLEGEKYAADASRAGFATKYGLPAGALNYLDHVETYAYSGIPASDKAFPVLIFSHGYGSRAHGYYALLSEMASQGYVIVNMNHTYESLGVTLPDGSEKYFDYDYQQKIADGSMDVVQPLLTRLRKGKAMRKDTRLCERLPWIISRAGFRIVGPKT